MLKFRKKVKRDIQEKENYYAIFLYKIHVYKYYLGFLILYIVTEACAVQLA